MRMIMNISRTKQLFPFALLCSLLLSACSFDKSGGNQGSEKAAGEAASQEEEKMEDAYHKITAEEAKKMTEEGNVVIVDVRTPEEYEEAHVPGAVSVPSETIGDEMPAALPDTDAVLIVYCRTGVRSRQASDKLSSLGYQKIYDMGGIVDWPYETESGAADDEQ